MSAPIHSQLADELNLPDEKAEKLLGAMLREVRKRALRQGVRLPDFGKFKEEGGSLVFEPSESLARAVNHRFEGLDSENLGSAPSTTTDETSSSNEGPDTITLGYQNSSNWSPIDAEEDTTDSTKDDEPDTAEFEVPSADAAADTEEIQAAGDATEEPTDQETESATPTDPPSPPSADPSRTETEELYPLVEDMPDEEDASDPASASGASEDDEEYDRERDTLSDIWGSKSKDAESDPAASSRPASPDPTPDSPSESPSEETDLFGDANESDEGPATASITQDTIAEPEDTSEEDEPEQSELDIPEDEEPLPSEEPSTEAEPVEEAPEPPKEKSTTLRVLTTLLILILVGGGAWYILGQRGIVPSPRTTFAQLKAQIGTPPLDGSSSSSAPTSSTTNSASTPDQDSATAGGTSTASTAESATNAEPSASSPETTAGSTSSGGSSTTIDPSAGGWTIVVASRTQNSGARSLAADFRQRFSDQQVPTGVLSGNVENTTRYRVGVGQFESRAAAQQFLDEFGSQLPDGAWPLRLQ